MPLIISGTIVDASGRTLSGQTVEAFWHSIRHADPLIVGLNCALGPKQLREHLDVLSRVADRPISAYPNAGLPNELGGYDETPEEMAEALGEWARHGLLNVAGSCCGSTPAHVAAIAAAVAGLPPRQIPEPTGTTRLSGLEPLVIPPPGNAFVNVGERTNVTGSRKFARLVADGAEDEAVDIAREQVTNGAQLIDVNMDEAMLDGVAAMTRFLRRIAAEPDIATSRSWSTARSGRSSRPVSSSSRARASSTRSRSRRAKRSSCARPASAGATARPSWSWPSTSRARPNRSSGGSPSCGAPTTC